MGVRFCSRASVKRALAELETARSNEQVDDAIEDGARDIEKLLHYSAIAPTLATHRFPYPDRHRTPSWRLWLNQHPLLSVTSFTTGGGATTLTPSQYLLEPDDGPPYREVQINLGGSGSFSSGDSWQRATAITGLWGLENTRKQVGSLAGTLAASTTATASLTWTTARFGVNDVLFIDDEAVIISELTYVDSGQNAADALDSDAADASLTVADGTGFAVDEVIQIGTEAMRVDAITGNVLTVTRAWDGSQLTTHLLGADVYALTGVELDRAQLGTTLAAHSTSAAVYRWVPPGPIATLNRAYALMTLLQERSGWGRTVQASSDTVIEVSGRGIKNLETDVVRDYGRRVRHRSI